MNLKSTVDLSSLQKEKPGRPADGKQRERWLQTPSLHPDRDEAGFLPEEDRQLRHFPLISRSSDTIKT